MRAHHARPSPTANCGHAGEICFAVEPALHWRHVLRGTHARERAEQAFSQLRVWDTEANNGVLLYLLLADHRIEIVADRGLRGVDQRRAWRGGLRDDRSERLRAGDPGSAMRARHRGDLRRCWPSTAPRAAGREDHDELPNKPRFL